MGFKTNQIADDAVTSAKIVDANITAAKLATGSAVSNIGAAGISATELASNAVTNAKILDSTIAAAKLAGSIATSNLADGSSLMLNSGDFSANSNKMTNLADPTASGDAVNKGYADLFAVTGVNE